MSTALYSLEKLRPSLLFCIFSLPAAACAGPPTQQSPTKRVHADLATLHSLLRQRDGEISVLQEDNGAKERELLHVLDLLQAAHTREGELRRQACNLAGQLDIMRDALQQTDGDLDALESAIAELGEDAFGGDGTELPSARRDAQAGLEQLALAREEAEVHKSKAAVLGSALKAAEEKSSTLQVQVARLQTYINSAPRGETSDAAAVAAAAATPAADHLALPECAPAARTHGRKGGSAVALRLTGLVVATRCAVLGLALLSSAVGSG